MSGSCQYPVNVTLLLALLLGLVAGASRAQQTPWERDPLATPRYEETVRWCRALAVAEDQVAYTTFGISPEGRDLPLLIWDPAGLADPQACHAAGRVILLVQACIHAGESSGKDAGMAWIRDLCLAGPDAPAGVTVLFIPIFNVDGHERFGPYNRINQDGPREMGWRTTAQNLNLNRDFLKADAPEMRAWLRLWNTWRPHMLVDTHATNGADYQYPVTYGLELHGNLDPGLTAWTADYLARLEAGLGAQGIPIAPYVTFRRWHDPRSGLRQWVAGPRYSQGYAAVRNRPGLLVETHMLKPYPVRVAATRAILELTLAHLADHRAALRALADAADARTASLAGRGEPVPLDFATGPDSVMVDFLGVRYEQVTSELSGGEYFVYHADEPETLRVPFFDQPVVTAAASLPAAYLVPPAWTAVLERLRWHAIRFDRLAAPAEVTVRGWRLEDVRWADRPYEGRHRVEFTAVPGDEVRTFPAGTAVVTTDQPGARVIAHALEPAAPDALLRWGFFDAVLTRVEYVESYVIERMMAEMVRDDPDLRAEFEAARAADADLAGDPWAIRQWFYRRTPYHDSRAFVYPVARIDDAAILATLPRE
jgi:hypothetical protein